MIAHLIRWSVRNRFFVVLGMLALVGAGLMVVVGVLSQEEAIKGVDWNTIASLPA